MILEQELYNHKNILIQKWEEGQTLTVIFFSAILRSHLVDQFRALHSSFSALHSSFIVRLKFYSLGIFSLLVGNLTGIVLNVWVKLGRTDILTILMFIP